MAGKRIAVDAEVIHAHAVRVDQVAADIGVARQAAAATNMGGGAFGVICSFLVAPATLAATMAASAISAAEGMVTRSAREVRGVAADAAAVEDDIVQAVRALEKGLG
ncbi:hypothetical protein IT072_14280 [Leifsonia sp. ZF2019]|uniref:hypothetical protein n=1 Tax=unclassified Leifsonia TaxID=2663824 RepID=UPI001CC06888|nr:MULTISPECIES: hypothetical protein [unclassified Leifsonia]UAJ78422.1 hypothetical protein IT072_14280 [Leifsonia sp. ZF2019]